MLQAVRRARLPAPKAVEVLRAFDDLGISLEEVSPEKMLAMAIRFDSSACDAAYLALAEERNARLVTADRRLHNAVSGRLP